MLGQKFSWLAHIKDLAAELTLDEIRGFAGQVDEDVYDWLDPARCISRRNLPGGTGPERVRQSIRKAKEEIGL